MCACACLLVNVHGEAPRSAHQCWARCSVGLGAAAASSWRHAMPRRRVPRSLRQILSTAFLTSGCPMQPKLKLNLKLKQLKLKHNVSYLALSYAA